jgi:hypothetical protein
VTEVGLAYNPFEPGFTDDPYPQYRAQRGLARLLVRTGV